jgi:hypothetical protein
MVGGLKAEALSEAEKLNYSRRSWIEQVSHSVLLVIWAGGVCLKPGAVRIIIKRFV